MIEPIYFPFTYVPQWVAEIFAAGFRHFYVYQPSGKDLPAEMQTWVEKGAINVCVPVSAEDKRFAEVVRAFQQFARLHTDVKDFKSAAFWNQQGAIPFFDETSASQIVADLKKGQQPDTRLTHPEALLRARVFLEFAQEFDRQNAELQRKLEDTHRRSEELIKNLSGQKDNEPASTRLTTDIKLDDAGDYMPQDRLQAWIRLFLEKPIDSGFLVTSSSTIFDSLVENQIPNKKLFEFKGLPTLASNDDTLAGWRETFYHQIKNGIESRGSFAEDAFARWPLLPEHAAPIKLTLYSLPDCTPTRLFARFLKLPNGDKNRFNQSPDIKNTLLGLVERNL
ncbi:MAG: hypothetical protein PVI38_05400 [Desulfobacterales bacterium]|jgi:hypothetical protein